MAGENEIIAVVKGDIKDFQAKMGQVSGKLKETTGMVDRYGNKIESANQKATASTTQAEGRFKSLGATLTKIGVYAAAAYGAFKAGEAVIRSSAGASDRLDIALGKVNGGLQAIFRSLDSLDFSNFLGNVAEAVRLGGELARLRDNLEDSTRSLTVVEAEYGAKVAELREYASDENNALKDRISAMQQAIVLQKKINTLRVQNAREAYDIAMKAMMGETHLQQLQIENLIKYYNQDKELRDKAERYNAAQRVAWDRLRQAGDVEVAMQLKQGYSSLTEALAAQPEAVKAYAVVLEKYGKASDKTLDDLIAKTKAMYDVIGTGSMTLKGLNRQLNGLTPNTKTTPTTRPANEGTFSPLASLSASLPNGSIAVEQLSLSLDKVTVSWEAFSQSVQRFDVSTKFNEIKQVTVDMNKELEYLAEDVLIGLAESIGSAFGGGTFNQGWNKFLIQIADWAQKLGAILVAAGLSLEVFQKQAAVNPMASVVFGLALIAAASAVKASVSKRPGAKGSAASPGGGGGGFDLTGFRTLKSGLTVNVNGTLKGNGKDLYAVIESETNRRSY